MSKQTVIFKNVRYDGPVIQAKREISYEIQVSSRFILDELCFKWNKQQLESAINEAIDTGDRERFYQLSLKYRPFIRE